MADEAEKIGKVVADIRNGRAKNLLGKGRQGESLFTIAERFAEIGPVIDATPIYHALLDKDDPINLYEDHECIAPPWDFGSICYVNEHGNVIVMSCMAVDWFNPPSEVSEEPGEMNRASWKMVADGMERLVGGRSPDRWDTAEPIDWDDIRWTIDTFVWAGGRKDKGRVPMSTGGPAHLWRSAIYPTGFPADLHWVQLGDENFYPMKNWDMAHLVLLGALNFCNASNTEVREPDRSRAEAKRVARTGVRVSQIHLKPTRKQAAAGQRGEPLNLTPLHGVRGHMAHFGDCCPGKHEPRGLAFGKLTGRYWIPFHARGSRDNGEIVQSYVLEAE